MFIQLIIPPNRPGTDAVNVGFYCDFVAIRICSDSNYKHSPSVQSKDKKWAKSILDPVDQIKTHILESMCMT